MSGFPAAAPHAIPVPAAAQPRDRDLLALDDPDSIERYLQPAPPAVPGGPWMEVTASIAFGTEGEGANYQLDGWSVTEDTFTWTNAPASRLRLPTLPDSDLCVLRLVGNPFVSNGILPSQRVEIWIDDQRLGVARATQVSVIECELPAGVLRPNQQATLTLRLPDAARPKDVTGFDDDRLLGFALHRLIIYRVHGGGQPRSAVA